MDQKELNEQLIEVARNGDLKSIRKLVKLGADINTKYWYGIERVNDHLNGYNYIEPDADWGMTPLMFFADRGILTRETLGEFLALGADINETNHFGRTALMLCTLNTSFSIELLDIFVRNGADINTEDDDGYTALILSAEENTLTPELLDAFVAHGADINRFNDNGSSAMMCAALWSSFTDKLSEVFARQFIRIGTSLKEIFEQVNWQENGTVSVLVHVMTERMETDPATVVNFVKKHVGAKLEKWIENGVPGMDRLMSKLAANLGEKSIYKTIETIEF